MQALLAAGIDSCDAVVVGVGSDGLSDIEADARVLTALLHVQEAVLAAKRPRAPHLVTPIRQHASRAMALAFLDDLRGKLAAEQRKLRLAGSDGGRSSGRRPSSGVSKMLAWLLAGAEAGGGDPPVVAPEVRAAVRAHAVTRALTDTGHPPCMLDITLVVMLGACCPAVSRLSRPDQRGPGTGVVADERLRWRDVPRLLVLS